MERETRLMEAVAGPAEQGQQRALLVVLSGAQQGAQFRIQGDVRLGRGEENELRLEQGSISRSHCVLRWNGGQPLIRDIGSRNGSKVNGVQLQVGQELPLCSGDRLELGELVFKFLLEGDIEASYHEELRRKAERDPLTGAFNKGYLLERLSLEIPRLRALGAPLALLLFDLDHFKALNDRHGHLVGDQVLRELVLRLRSQLRKGDILARFGGEEFAVILPETEGYLARRMAERLRAAVADEVFVLSGAAIQVRISLGVALLDEEIETAEALLEAADAMLYRAKGAGRDRVVG